MRKAALLVLALAVTGGVLIWIPSVLAQSPTWPGPPYLPVSLSFSASGDNTILSAPATVGVNCVYGMSLTNASTTTATTIQVKDAQNILWTTYLAANGGSANWQLQNGNAKNPYFMNTAHANTFIINSSAAVQIDGGIYAAICPLF